MVSCSCCHRPVEMHATCVATTPHDGQLSLYLCTRTRVQRPCWMSVCLAVCLYRMNRDRVVTLPYSICVDNNGSWLASIIISSHLSPSSPAYTTSRQTDRQTDPEEIHTHMHQLRSSCTCRMSVCLSVCIDEPGRGGQPCPIEYETNKSCSRPSSIIISYTTCHRPLVTQHPDRQTDRQIQKRSILHMHTYSTDPHMYE